MRKPASSMGQSCHGCLGCAGRAPSVSPRSYPRSSDGRGRRGMSLPGTLLVAIVGGSVGSGLAIAGGLVSQGRQHRFERAQWRRERMETAALRFGEIAARAQRLLVETSWGDENEGQKQAGRVRGPAAAAVAARARASPSRRCCAPAPRAGGCVGRANRTSPHHRRHSTRHPRLRRPRLRGSQGLHHGWRRIRDMVDRIKASINKDDAA